MTINPNIMPVSLFLSSKVDDLIYKVIENENRSPSLWNKSFVVITKIAMTPFCIINSLIALVETVAIACFNRDIIPMNMMAYQNLALSTIIHAFSPLFRSSQSLAETSTDRTHLDKIEAFGKARFFQSRSNGNTIQQARLNSDVTKLNYVQNWVQGLSASTSNMSDSLFISNLFKANEISNFGQNLSSVNLKSSLQRSHQKTQEVLRSLDQAQDNLQRSFLVSQLKAQSSNLITEQDAQRVKNSLLNRVGSFSDQAYARWTNSRNTLIQLQNGSDLFDIIASWPNLDALVARIAAANDGASSALYRAILAQDRSNPQSVLFRQDQIDAILRPFELIAPAAVAAAPARAPCIEPLAPAAAAALRITGIDPRATYLYQIAHITDQAVRFCRDQISALFSDTADEEPGRDAIEDLNAINQIANYVQYLELCQSNAVAPAEFGTRNQELVEARRLLSELTDNEKRHLISKLIAGDRADVALDSEARRDQILDLFRRIGHLSSVLSQAPALGSRRIYDTFARQYNLSSKF